MLFIRHFWKLLVMVVGGFSLLGVVTMYAARLPNQEVCITIQDNDGSSSRKNYLFDLNSGRLQRDRRRYGGFITASSPDGQTYAYIEAAKDGDKLHNLFIQSADGQNRILLRSEIFPAYSNFELASYLRWSHDRKRIAYLWTSAEKNIYLSTAASNGENQQTVQLTSPDDKPLTLSSLLLNDWSSDDAYISVAWQRLADTGYGFWSADSLQPAAPELGKLNLQYGRWSPEGHHFAAISQNDNGQLAFALLDPEHDAVLSQTGLSSAEIEYLGWSPDGKYIVVVAKDNRCVGESCQKYWAYNFFNQGGMPVGGDIPGSQVISKNSSVSMGAGFELSPAVMAAGWASGGHDWVFLQEAEKESTDQPALDLRILDVESGQQEVIASRIIPEFADHVFNNHIFWISGLPASFQKIVALPIGDRVTLPTWQDGHIQIESSALSDENRSTLVVKADEIIGPHTPNPFNLFWWWNERPLIVWAAGKDDERRINVTVAQKDGSAPQTFDLNLKAISDPGWINQAWVGFMGEDDQGVNIYALNFDTGQAHVLASQIGVRLGDRMTWTITFAPQEMLATVSYAHPTQPRQTLYLTNLTEATTQELTGDVIAFPAWATDGKKVAFVQGTNSATTQELRVISQSGSLIGSYGLPSQLKFHPWIREWTTCE